MLTFLSGYVLGSLVVWLSYRPKREPYRFVLYGEMVDELGMLEVPC